MKRPLLIILGIIFVLVLLGIWVYVLLTGSPTNGDRFGDFDLGDTTDPTFTEQPATPDDQPVVDVTDPAALRQLTTTPVAGFVEVRPDASSTPRVHYVESGTGHIFSIDLETGEENRISATTIPITTGAALTPNGAYVLLQSGSGVAAEYIIGTLATSSDELSNFALPEAVLSYTASTDNELLYTTPDGNQTLARAYNPQTNTTRTLFTVPFRDVTVSWNQDSSGPHLVYPKAASRLQGFVYSYTNGEMSRLPIDGFGLSAVGSSEAVIFSNIMVGVGDYISSAYQYEETSPSDLPLSIVPEKCAFDPTDPGTAICGASVTAEYPNTMPDDWYRGDLTFADSLWQVRPAFGAATLFENITESKRQRVDIIHPTFSADGSRLYFQNKIDNTLWVYDFTN